MVPGSIQYVGDLTPDQDRHTFNALLNDEYQHCCSRPFADLKDSQTSGFS